MNFTDEQLDLIMIALASAGHFNLPNMVWDGSRVELTDDARVRAHELFWEIRKYSHNN